MAKKKYSADERKAYWIGVGISAQFHGDGQKILNCRNSKFRNSVRAGYEADNRNDVSRKLVCRVKK